MHEGFSQADSRANRWLVFHNQDPRHARLAVPSNPPSTIIFFKMEPPRLRTTDGNAGHRRRQTESGCDENSALPF